MLYVKVILKVIPIMQSFWTLIFLILILGISLWIYRKSTKAYQKFPSVSICRDFLSEFLFLPRGISFTSRVFQLLIVLSKKFETEGMFLIWPLHPILFIFSEEAFKVFSNEKAAIDKTFYYDILTDLIGEGTITRNGEDWKKHRKMFNPVFYTGMLKRSISIINEYASTMTKELATVTNKPVNLLDYFKEHSFCAVCEFLLGMKMNEEETKELGQRFLKVIEKLTACTTHRLCYPWLRYRIFLYCSAYGRESLKWYDERNRVLSEITSRIKEANSLRSSETKSENECGQSFATILLENNMKDPNFTIKDMEDEIFTYLFAGYDTVAFTLLWCIFLLGHHQDIQNKVFTEVQSTTGKFITYDDIFRLKHLQSVIKESQRLYPAVPIYGRHLKRDVQCGKYKVPKGTALGFFSYRLHRNSEIFPDPENFNPDRFLDGSVEKRPRAYVPFAEGVRSCIGKKFAMMEMTIFLAYIIKSYQIQSLVEREAVEFDWVVTLMPQKPLFMELTPRKP